MRCRALLMFGTLLFATAGTSNSTTACDCHQAHAIAMSVPTFGGLSMAQPLFGSLSVTGMETYGSEIAYESSNAFELPLAPSPPGTLGQTYQRLSHPVPVDEHLRTAMLAVRDNGSTPFLSVQTMGGFRMKNGIWLFESSRPLDPGACQIVRVEARHNSRDIEPYDTKFVRLIPGRIVYLDF